MQENESLDDYAQQTANAVEGIDTSLIGSDVDFTLEQVITKNDAVVGHYHLVLAKGSASVHPGASAGPDIVIKQDAETARAIRAGELHAQGAFLTGKLSIDGDINKLLEHGPLLSSLLDG